MTPTGRQFRLSHPGVGRGSDPELRPTEGASGPTHLEPIAWIVTDPGPSRQLDRKASIASRVVQLLGDLRAFGQTGIIVFHAIGHVRAGDEDIAGRVHGGTGAAARQDRRSRHTPSLSATADARRVQRY